VGFAADQPRKALFDVLGQQFQRADVERLADFFDFGGINLHRPDIARLNRR
jgi:hypothetical protein